MYGIGAKYTKSDADRLIRKLLLRGYLTEEMVVNQAYDTTNAYVVCGNKAGELLNGNQKVKVLLDFMSNFFQFLKFLLFQPMLKITLIFKTINLFY